MRALFQLAGHIDLFINADAMRRQINQKMEDLKKSLAEDDEEDQEG